MHPTQEKHTVHTPTCTICQMKMTFLEAHLNLRFKVMRKKANSIVVKKKHHRPPMPIKVVLSSTDLVVRQTNSLMEQTFLRSL